ncbi:hypothetical protein [Rhodococcus erythropolis]|uniref:hypothetical protein n=1 Tax=Rhodococcus erythropolis TaxID=1833 RepID=UPI001BEA6A40|nr:hypothetical protein [Rhodococcus erythropolis]MBT2263902.1 hypothetical protein [Rhodococcus erythropolis]
MISRVGASVAAAVAVLSIAAVPATASAAPPGVDGATGSVADGLSSSVPAVGGLEVGPGGVPGGSFQPVTVTTRPVPGGSVHVEVVDPAPWSVQFAYRYLSVAWRNLESGKTGTVELRHWQPPSFGIDGYPMSLPTSATVLTGPGPVVATVTVLREQYEAPALPISVIPGLAVVLVPN